MCSMSWIGVVFFFKQKTAYEMRISDWSSDVCSSDLDERHGAVQEAPHPTVTGLLHERRDDEGGRCAGPLPQQRRDESPLGGGIEIGRASCRERVCQYV